MLIGNVINHANKLKKTNKIIDITSWF
jgi:hypothetical protein